MQIDAKGCHYRTLNQQIKDAVKRGEKHIELLNVNGQRYIGDGVSGDAEITINGVPGNDLGAFMSGPTIIVNSFSQDGVANTMNDGKIVIKGHAGDVLGYGMRGGKLFVKGDVGYRVGIHMKEYEDKIPVIIAGGKAGDFFGEYMAGGVLILLNLNNEKPERAAGSYLATGMHGGVIYIRGEIDKYQLGEGVEIVELKEADNMVLNKLISEFCKDLNIDTKSVFNKPFKKLIPSSKRPYGKLYAY
ncbi:MAG: hypothetical protein HY096_05100 [Nitrospinae bacterium]|nr:hypothetical protein [Nitrospinota bacterium]